MARSALIAAAVVVGLLVPAAQTFPSDIELSFSGPVNDVVDWLRSDALVAHRRASRTPSRYVVLNPLQTVLDQSPWWLAIGVIGGIACWSRAPGGRRRRRSALLLIVRARPLAGRDGDARQRPGRDGAHARASAWARRSCRRATSGSRAMLRPLLDVAQTMPSFVYLLPALVLFGPSRFTAIFAAIIYAVPPVIRLVEAGHPDRAGDDHRGGDVVGLHRAPAAQKVQLPCRGRRSSSPRTRG